MYHFIQIIYHHYFFFTDTFHNDYFSVFPNNLNSAVLWHKAATCHEGIVASLAPDNVTLAFKSTLDFFFSAVFSVWPHLGCLAALSIPFLTSACLDFFPSECLGNAMFGLGPVEYPCLGFFFHSE